MIAIACLAGMGAWYYDSYGYGLMTIVHLLVLYTTVWHSSALKANTRFDYFFTPAVALMIVFQLITVDQPMETLTWGTGLIMVCTSFGICEVQRAYNNRRDKNIQRLQADATDDAHD